MALVFIEGFDHFTAAQATAKGWSGAFTAMDAGRIAGQSARQGSGSVGRTKILPSTYSTLFGGFAFKAAAFTSAADIYVLQSGATNTFQMLLNASNQIQIKNSSGTAVATGTTVLAINTWYYIEFKLVINGASGTCEVHLNGASGEIATTTGNFGSANVDRVGLPAAGSGANNNDYDDMYLCDTTGSAPNNTFLGEVAVTTMSPNADGTHTQWTPSSGTAHYANVDETTPDDDATYNLDANIGDIDTFLYPGVLASAAVIGIQVNDYARKDDASLRQIAPVIRQGGVDYVGNTNTLGITYLFYSQNYDTDPAGNPWTAATLNADEIGVKLIA